MKIITLILASISVVADAQESVRSDVDQSIPIIAVTKEVGVAKWTCTDKSIYNEVTVLDMKGTWAKIEYTLYSSRPPRVGGGEIVVMEDNQPKRVQTWVNSLHVLRIEPVAITATEEKKQNKAEMATPNQPSD